jgi:hypothetical protein
MHSEGKILRKNFKGLFKTFSLKIQKIVKEFFGFFPLNFQFSQCFCKRIFRFFPLIFQCFCKGILDKFLFKNEKINPQFRPKNEKFTPSIFACKTIKRKRTKL